MDSPLRHLARDFFNGQIERPDYLEKRRQLLDSLPGEALPAESELVVPAVPDDVFPTETAELTSSDDLVSALAGRAGGAEPGERTDAAVMLQSSLESSGSAIQDQVANTVQVLSAGTSEQSWPGAAPDAERSLSRRYRPLLLLAAVCAAIMVCIVWLS